VKGGDWQRGSIVGGESFSRRFWGGTIEKLNPRWPWEALCQWLFGKRGLGRGETERRRKKPRKKTEKRAWRAGREEKKNRPNREEKSRKNKKKGNRRKHFKKKKVIKGAATRSK